MSHPRHFALLLVVLAALLVLAAPAGAAPAKGPHYTLKISEGDVGGIGPFHSVDCKKPPDISRTGSAVVLDQSECALCIVRKAGRAES